MNQILNNLTEDYNAFLKLVDPVLLDSLKERRQEIIDKWGQVNNKLINSHREKLKGSSMKDLEQKNESTMKDLESWIANVEDFMSKEQNGFNDDQIVELQVLITVHLLTWLS